MNVDKDGIVHQPSRKWYSMRETLEIYANGGHVVLTLKEPTPRLFVLFVNSFSVGIFSTLERANREAERFDVEPSRRIVQGPFTLDEPPTDDDCRALRLPRKAS